MKKIVLSAVAVLGLSSFAVAGGDVAPVAPIVEPEAGNFYMGVAYSQLGLDQTQAVDDHFEAVMLQAGYKFNQYIAVEGRYWHGFEETIPTMLTDLRFQEASADVWGIYVKPMYPVLEGFDIYGLLGYGSIDYDTSVESIDGLDGFSWGLGAAYSLTENVSVFADYVNIYEDDSNVNNLNSEDVIDSYNFGVSYTF